MVPAFSWKAVQGRPGLPASERIASEGDDQNGRIVVKLVAIGQTNATIRAPESRICRQWMATDKALPPTIRFYRPGGGEVACASPENSGTTPAAR